jgi:hypothetical protein
MIKKSAQNHASELPAPHGGSHSVLGTPKKAATYALTQGLEDSNKRDANHSGKIAFYICVSRYLSGKTRGICLQGPVDE